MLYSVAGGVTGVIVVLYFVSSVTEVIGNNIFGW